MGEGSLDATAGNPQSAGGKARRKRCAARSIDVHDRPWDINVPKSHFYELILQDRHPNTISKLSAKYQFCAISTADTRDGKLTTRGVYPWVVHRLSTVCPPFIPALFCTPSPRSSRSFSCRTTLQTLSPSFPPTALHSVGDFRIQFSIRRQRIYLFIYLLCHIYPGVPHQCATLFSLGLLIPGM